MSFSGLKWEGSPLKGMSLRADISHFQFRVWQSRMGKDKGLYCGFVYLVIRSDDEKISMGQIIRTIDPYPTLDLAKEKVLEEGLKIVKEIVDEAKILVSFPWTEKRKLFPKQASTYEKEMTHLLLRITRITEGEHEGEYFVGAHFTQMDGGFKGAHRCPTLDSAKRDGDQLIPGIVEEIAKEAGLQPPK